MKNYIFILVLSLLFISCTSLTYNYSQSEFVNEYRKSERYFDRVVGESIRKSDLKKLEKRFVYLKKQLHKNNENYERIDENTVKVYDNKINEYIMFINDLKD